MRDQDLEARDRGVDNSSPDETETKAFRARDRDEAEAYQLETASRPRRQDRSHIPGLYVVSSSDLFHRCISLSVDDLASDAVSCSSRQCLQIAAVT